MAGRKRKPTKLHLVQGTARPCRINKSEPKPPAEPPRAVVELSPRASFWYGILCGRLSSMGIASNADSENVMLLALRLAEIEECDDEIKRYGRVTLKIELIKVPEKDEAGKTVVVTKAQKVLKANPAVAQRSEAMRHAQSLLAEFGLSPASRASVSASGGGSTGSKNPWEALL